MESYNSHTAYSFSSSNSSTSNYSRLDTDKPIPSYISSLHAVRKPPILQPKPMLKKPIAPLPPNPPKVYKVDHNNFKRVVQKLTSVPEFQNSASRRLQDVAPPPLNISSAPYNNKLLIRSLSNNATNYEMTSDHAPPLPAATSQSLPSPLPAIFRDLMDDNLFDPIPTKGLGDQLVSSTSPVLGFSLTPNFSSFLNETLENSGHDDDKPTSTKSCESWGLLLSPLGFNMSPTIRNSTTKAATSTSKLSDCFGSLMSPLAFGLSPSSAAWCSLALASPGADHHLTPMGQTTVL